MRMAMKNECGRKGLRAEGLAASLSVEAALCLTLFMFTVILLSVPMEILDAQRRVQTVLESTARELSWQAYFFYRKEAGAMPERNDVSGADAVPEDSGSRDREEVAALFAEGALELYLREKIRAVGGNQLERVDCSGSRISDGGERIDLRAQYRFRLPFSVFALDSVKLSSRSLRRGWIGKEGGGKGAGSGESEVKTMVYIGRNGSRYHLSASCHYISNEISMVDFENVGGYRNSEGKRYRPCSRCGGAAEGGHPVYLLPGGEYYHSRADCSSLNYYVRRVPLSEVKHLGACSYCGGGR